MHSICNASPLFEKAFLLGYDLSGHPAYCYLNGRCKASPLFEKALLLGYYLCDHPSYCDLKLGVSCILFSLLLDLLPMIIVIVMWKLV